MPVTPETVGSVGEFPLIERITSGLAMGPAVSVGPGDDAAVFLVNGSAVTSVDVLVEGVHFRRDWVPAERLGRRAVAVSCSDLEAMGAHQVAVLVGLSVPGDLEASWVADLARGIRAECEAAGASLVGGDVTRSRDVTLAMTVVGELRGRPPVLRSGARPGDVVAVQESNQCRRHVAKAARDEDAAGHAGLGRVCRRGRRGVAGRGADDRLGAIAGRDDTLA